MFWEATLRPSAPKIPSAPQIIIMAMSPRMDESMKNTNPTASHPRPSVSKPEVLGLSSSFFLPISQIVMPMSAMAIVPPVPTFQPSGLWTKYSSKFTAPITI